jgi:hypothetical protein
MLFDGIKISNPAPPEVASGLIWIKLRKIGFLADFSPNEPYLWGERGSNPLGVTTSGLISQADL